MSIILTFVSLVAVLWLFCWIFLTDRPIYSGSSFSFDFFASLVAVLWLFCWIFILEV